MTEPPRPSAPHSPTPDPTPYEPQAPSYGGAPPPGPSFAPPPSYGGAPPPYSAPSSGGFGQPGARPLTADEERLWILGAHGGAAVLAVLTSGTAGFVAPLVVLLTQKASSVRRHAVASLNFQLTMLGVALALLILSVVTLGLGFFLFFPLWVFVVIISVLASVKAYNGEFYKYPLTYDFVK